MSLKNILDKNVNKHKKEGDITEERLMKVLPELRNLISFFREYPDYFVDFIKGEDSTFEFLFYQRLWLRCMVRYKNFYGVAPRAFAKSFLAMMGKILQATLYPNSDLFITTGGKEQAASITLAKVNEISKLIPALGNEMITGRGSGSKTGKDNTQFLFWNGSRVGNLAAAESSRGQRRTGGTVEEVILVDKNALNEVIIPTMNVDRRLGDGTTDTKELINKSLTYITTAGYRDSFSYDKLKELFIQSVAEPENTIVLGNTYKVPIKEGLLNANFVQELKLQGTFSEDSFLREYCSVWSGSSEDAFFSSEAFDRARTLKNPDNAYDGRTTRGYYVLGVDVGRLNCTTEVIVIKVVPQKYGPDNKNIVNIYTFEDEHFEKQAANLKRLYYQYQAKIMVVDCNGIGAGLLDFLLKPTHDTDTGNEYPPFGVYNDDDGYYKKYRTPDMELDAVWVMKANLQLNTEMYTYCKVQLTSGRLNFLVDEVQAKNDLVQQIGTANKKYEYLQERLKPYILTTALKEQMCNLKETNDNNNIILKQVTRGIKKDKFSGLIYGLYFIHLEEEKRKKKRNRDISKLMLVN